MSEFPYLLTQHAGVVVVERGIRREWIHRVLQEPESTEDDAVDADLRHALGRIEERGGRMLRVVYNDTVEPWRIVTVFFDRRFGRREEGSQS